VSRVSSEMTIAEAARRSGLSAHTLRYYERIGLIHPVERGANGHRRYGRAMLERHRTAIAARMVQLEETARVLDRKIAMYHEMENT
jgi:DNA-binding transcriptional MerR regulator